MDRGCSAKDSISSLEDRCLGQSTCLFTVRSEVFGGFTQSQCSGFDAASDNLIGLRLAATLACGDGSLAAAAAAARPGLGLGWRFNILVLLVFGLYFGLGVWYNVQRKGAKGVEAIPHLEMWKDLPFLVRDGVVFAVDTIKSKGRPGYDGL